MRHCVLHERTELAGNVLRAGGVQSKAEDVSRKLREVKARSRRTQLPTLGFDSLVLTSY